MLALNSRARSTVAVRALRQARLAHSKATVCIVGAGTAGVTVASQLQRAWKAEGRQLANEPGSIAIIDEAKEHHYQPGWTLVGTGLAPLDKMRKPMSEVIPTHAKHHNTSVASFEPEKNQVTTKNGDTISYDYLVVVPGLKSDFSKVEGLEDALSDPNGPVSSIYRLDSVVKTWNNIRDFQGGRAIFTQPAGIVKCAGAPQKVLWMALSQWNKDGKRSSVKPAFATGTPTMFGVPKYSAALEKLRKERDVDGLFSHNLVKVDAKARKATFAKPDGTTVVENFDLLHVVPPQSPPDFIRTSSLADGAGWVSVDPATTQHTKYANIFSIGDASSLPNSKTAAAITAQAPVLVDNLRAVMDGKKELPASYDGYASCPLLTGHNELMLAEFKYGGVPKETFAPLLGSQDKPSSLFYWLKKDIFPLAYWNAFVKGIWFGPRGLLRPTAY